MRHLASLILCCEYHAYEPDSYIGGTGEGQSEAAWRLPLALQLVPALVLGVGILFMPFSPRWLVNKGRDEEAVQVLCRARNLPADSDLIQIEFLYVCFIGGLPVSTLTL